MKFIRRNTGTITGLLIAIAVVSFLGTGCGSSQGVGTSGKEMNASDIPAAETELYNTTLFNMESMESAVDDDTSEEGVSVGDVHLFEQEEKISTMFYDLQLDKVTFTDSVGGMTAESGREFMVLDVTFTTDSSEMVLSMYAQEFIMVCFTGDTLSSDREDYEMLYPLEEKLEDGQFDDVWLVTTGEDTKGKLVYNIPKDTIRNTLLVYDSYAENDFSSEMVFGDGYMMTILNENWSREE